MDQRRMLATDVMISGDPDMIAATVALLYFGNREDFLSDALIGIQDRAIDTLSDTFIKMCKKVSVESGIFEESKKTLKIIKDELKSPSAACNILPPNVMIGQALIKAGEKICREGFKNENNN